MEIVIFLVVGVVAFALIMFVLEPYRFLPDFEGKAKKVGSAYWGIYDGASTKDIEALQSVAVCKPARKHIYTAGSATYAAGRGVKMS